MHSLSPTHVSVDMRLRICACGYAPADMRLRIWELDNKNILGIDKFPARVYASGDMRLRICQGCFLISFSRCATNWFSSLLMCVI